MIVKIVIVAIITIFISSTVKPYNKEFSSVVSVCGGVIIFLFCIDELSLIIAYFTEILNLANLDFDVVKTAIKIVGVGYITEFTSDIADDFGNKTLSSKVLLGGKIVICGMTLPIIKSILSILLSLLS